MLFTLMFSMLVFLLLYWWLMLHRFRVEYLELRDEEAGLDVAIEARRAEAAADLVPGGVAR
jgi:heme exporter protein C